MRHKKFFLAALASALLFGSTSVQAADANAFNPYTGKPLPVTRQVKGEEAKILSALGGTPRSIAADAAYRANWKEEIYPILKGSTASRHEVLVVIDFADPKSRQIWQQVARVAKATPDASARFVLFGKSAELYATDLTGLAIWACRERKGQAIDYVTWAMQRWDSIKQGLKKQGKARPFHNEYDAVLTRKDYPMVFVAMEKCFKPRVAAAEQSNLATYAYEAGNINLFQASEVCRYYELKKASGLIVDGEVLDNPADLAARIK